MFVPKRIIPSGNIPAILENDLADSGHFSA